LLTHCNALQRTTTHFYALQRTATHYNLLQRTALHCDANCRGHPPDLKMRLSRHFELQPIPCHILQHTATHCNTLQHTATHCNTLQHTATHCNTTLQVYPTESRRWLVGILSCNSLQHILQHTATHCNTLQHNVAGVPEGGSSEFGAATHCNTCCNALRNTYGT